MILQACSLMPSTPKWNTRNAWIASFDILGFKKLANVKGDTVAAQLVMDDYEQVLQNLNEASDLRALGSVSYFWLSDTFVLFTENDSTGSYRLIQFASKRFIEECIYSGVPIRGAISVGSLVISDDHKSVMGDGFIDAFITGEDQDWLGLLLSKKAISHVRGLGLEPTKHDFVTSNDIPMRKLNAADVMAYRFQNGAANFESPLLHILESMRSAAGACYAGKYERTVDFIKKHYVRIKTE